MEKMANLDQLPHTGFEVICFPVKVAPRLRRLVPPGGLALVLSVSG